MFLPVVSVLVILSVIVKDTHAMINWFNNTILKHRHAKRARVIFFVIRALNVQQERNWEFMMYIRCYIGNGNIAK